ncbi:MAG TPA: hypothetical protein VGC95_02670 [Chitinophagaceae bacterium]
MKNIPIFLLLLLAFNARSQTGLTNTGTLYVKTGSDILFVTGTFTNNAGSALTNNGGLYVQGDLSNSQASMAVGTGTLYLNGASTQTVSGTQKFKTYNLQTNNAAGIVLNNDLSVTSAHTYSAGIITTSSTPNYLVYESGSSYSGTTDATHVNGWVKRLGSTSFTFPVGDNTYLRTVDVNISAAGEFNVSYATLTPNTTLMELAAPLVSIDKKEYWLINQVTGGSATIGLNWNNGKVPFPNWTLANIRATSWNGTQWVDVGGSASGNVTTTGNITSNSVSSFSRFTFAGVTLPLPLTLISFDARHILDHTEIDWTTDDEINLAHFLVQRSDDGTTFYTVTQVPARNRGIREIYSAVDTHAINGVAFYRLCSVDIDGKFKYSRIVPVRVNDSNNNFVLLTNPVHDRLRLLAGNGITGTFTCLVTGSNGQLLQQGTITLTNGGSVELRLPASARHGTYDLTIANSSEAYHFRFVVL